MFTASFARLMVLAIVATCINCSIAHAQGEKLLFLGTGYSADGLPLLPSQDDIAAQGATNPTSWYLSYVEEMLGHAIIAVSYCHADVNRMALHPTLTAGDPAVQAYTYKGMVTATVILLAKKMYLAVPKPKRTEKMKEAYTMLLGAESQYAYDNNHLMREIAARGKLEDESPPPQPQIRKF